MRGPRHESSFVAAAPGSPSSGGRRPGAAAGQGRPDPGTRTSPLLASEPNKSGRSCPGPSRTPHPRPPAGRVSPCGLQPQRCWPGGAAGRWGRAGRSPLRSGGGPLRAPGKPEADERRCPLLGLGATRGRRQKRVRGEKVTRPPGPPGPRPTPRDGEARSPRGRHGNGNAGRPGPRSPALTLGLGSGSCKVQPGPGARVRDPAGAALGTAGRPTLQAAQARSRVGPPARRLRLAEPDGGRPGSNPARLGREGSPRGSPGPARNNERSEAGAPSAGEPPRRRLCSRSRR